MASSLGEATLTDRAILAGSEALAGRQRGLRSLLPFAGPAVIASVAYMDPGNFATNIQAGAKYNYNLLWVVVVANIIAMIFQALSAKLGIVGATVMPHAIYLHSGLTQDRVLPRTNEERRRLLRFSNREVVLALGLAGLVNMAMLAMAASVFHNGLHEDVAE